MLNRLTPSNIKRTATDLMKEWERSLLLPDAMANSSSSRGQGVGAAAAAGGGTVNAPVAAVDGYSCHQQQQQQQQQQQSQQHLNHQQQQKRRGGAGEKRV